MVSAGAGAGKTRVLVSRMAELIMDQENPIEADRFLVLTFTNAAAAEMKERISLDLEERLSQDPENYYLKKQIRKIRQADISTVHSFCNRLIRTHYNELSMDPSFRIGEEGELFLLRQQAIEQLLEEAYAAKRESFVKFVESYAPGKNDKVLEEMIGDLYRFSRSFPNAEVWFEKIKAEALQLAEAKDWEYSPAVMLIFSKAKKELLQIQEELSEVLTYIDEEEVPDKYSILLQNIKEYVDALAQTEGYDEYYKALSRGSIAAFPRAAKKDKEWTEYERVKEFHQRVKELLQKQKETVFTATAQELQREAAAIYPLLEEYITLVQRFEEIYLTQKKEKNVYDFDDLEHFALELLVETYDEEGRAQPSETAKSLSEKYKMIFVDEYQDTNLVQETILEMLSDKEKNTLFTVGDVKQSIYRFRQARPDLFLRRNEKYTSVDNEGVSIELRDNFRSAPGVLHFTNYIFSHLMEREFGGVDYNEKTALRAGQGGPMQADKETSEVLFFMRDTAPALEDMPDDILIETAVIAKRIKELIEEGYHYGDMVILLRSGAGRMEQMAEFLEKAGISVSCENKTGYFHTREITIMLNYLSIVDNEAGAGTENEDVVRIMTIHKSKGLEFPVVFVSGLSKKFNRMDLNKPVLCHPEFGIGMECVDTVLRFHHPSLMKKAIQEKVWKDTLEEEMRILYVAMTRAKRKLILTGLIKAEELDKGIRASIQNQKWRATSSMDWLLPILADRFRISGEERASNKMMQKDALDNGWLNASLISWEKIVPFFEREKEQERTFSYKDFVNNIVLPADESVVKRTFSYVYPNRDATKWKRKYSVSELKTIAQTNLPEEDSEYLSEVFSEEDCFEEGVKIPQFLKEEKEEIEATTRGTIIHKIMELLPFAQIQTRKQLFDWMTTLKDRYPESEKVSAKWLYKAIEAFLFSETGEKLCQMDKQGSLKKELPFTVGLPVSLMNQDTQAKDTVVVQGIIDLCGETNDALWLIDYKTDRIKEGEERLLLDRYGNQMLYYKAALEQILGKRVGEIYLYSFSLKKFISVNLQERSGENA